MESSKVSIDIQNHLHSFFLLSLMVYRLGKMRSLLWKSKPLAPEL